MNGVNGGPRVVQSGNNNSAELAVIPIGRLRVDASSLQ
jgi:hypothetical protein